MASFPSAIATNAQLLVALDNAQTTLASGISSGATTLTVVSAAAIASDTVVTIDAEQILLGTVVGTLATGCTRGYAGTTPAAHSAGAVVYANVIAAHHNRTREELIAVQTALGAGMRFTRNTHRTTAYRWTVTFAQSLAIGTVTVNFSTGLPDGLTATYSPNQHRLYITDATSGNEEVLVTAIVGTQVTFAVTINHTSGQWTLGTATEGIQEAHYANMGSPLYIPNGEYTVSEIYLTSANAAAENIFSVEGEDWIGTKLIPRSATQNFFKWVGSWSLGAYSLLTFSRLNFIKSASASYQTAGACIYFNGHGYLTVNSCRFDFIFNGVYVLGVSCFFRTDGIFGNGIVNHLIYLSGNPAPGPNYASTFQIQNLYAAGRYKGTSIDPANEGLSPGLIWIQASTGGGTAANLWMQAAAAHLVFAADLATGRKCNEITITNALLDMDSLGVNVTGAIICSNNSGVTSAGSSNCINISASYINTNGYAILSQFMENVYLHDCVIRTGGEQPVAAFNTCRRYGFYNNIVRVDTLAPFIAPPAIIYMVNTTAGENSNVQVFGNKVHSQSLTIPAFVLFGLNEGENIIVENNTCFQTTALASSVGTLTRDKVVLRGNVVPSYVPATITAAATIAIPFDDDDTIAVIDGATAITRITGGQPGMKRQYIASGTGTLTFNTGGVSPGRIAIAKTVAANEPFTAVYYAADAYMRIMKGA